MNRLEQLDEASKRKVEEIARELSSYGLGVFVPHAHDNHGNIGPLPTDVVAFEKDLQVTFVPKSELPCDAIAVGWRWQEGALEVCTHCCSGV
jgi:hypothetical protein